MLQYSGFLSLASEHYPGGPFRQILSISHLCSHAASGCDSTSAFFGIGKQRWLNLIEEHPELHNGLCHLGDSPSDINPETEAAIVSLVSLLYCGKKLETLDLVRYELFAKKHKQNEKLPPTMDSFRLHLKRANFQSFIWNHATVPYLKVSPIDNGWILDDDGHLVPSMMLLPPAPEAILAFTQCGCQADCSTRRCRCRKDDVVCSDVCKCIALTTAAIGN